MMGNALMDYDHQIEAMTSPTLMSFIDVLKKSNLPTSEIEKVVSKLGTLALSDLKYQNSL